MRTAASTWEVTTDSQESGTSLAGRLAARAVALSLDAANALDDVADHLVRLSGGDAVSLRGAVQQVERRQDHPASAPSQLALRALRMATARTVDAPTSAPAASN